MQLLRVALACLSVLALAAVAWVATARIGHPFELEWMEGGMLQHVERVSSGEPLYAAPTLEFMAYPYTPLFVYLGAAASQVVGAGFATLRALALASSVACGVLLFLLVLRETRRPLAALCAAGLFAASYEFTGAWLDVARVDTLSLALFLAAVLCVRGGKGPGRAVLAGLLLSLAFFAKQSAALPALGLAVAVFAERRSRDGGLLAGTFALLLVTTTFALDRLSAGWYRWHVFELLAGHPVHGPSVLGFWTELAAALGPAFAIAAWVRATGERWGTFHWIVAASLVGTAWVGRMHVGGFDNTLLPAAAAAALLFGLGIGRVLEEPGRRARLVLAAGLVQFALLAWDPRTRIPTEADRQAGERVVAALAAVEGEVWVPYHGYLAERADKRAGAHAMPIIDLLQGSDRETAQLFVDELVAALAARRFAMIVLDDLSWERDLPPLTRYYARTRSFLDPDRPDVFRPRSGEPQRPVYVYEPR